MIILQTKAPSLRHSDPIEYLHDAEVETHILADWSGSDCLQVELMFTDMCSYLESLWLCSLLNKYI